MFIMFKQVAETYSNQCQQNLFAFIFIFFNAFSIITSIDENYSPKPAVPFVSSATLVCGTKIIILVQENVPNGMLLKVILFQAIFLMTQERLDSIAHQVPLCLALVLISIFFIYLTLLNQNEMCVLLLLYIKNLMIFDFKKPHHLTLCNYSSYHIQIFSVNRSHFEVPVILKRMVY